MIIFMFYTEDESFGGLVSIPIVDQFMAMYGYKLEGIHPKDSDYIAKGLVNIYDTLEDAKVFYSDYEWIYLDPNASLYIDEISHPIDNVVYIVGHDINGFENSDLSDGIKIKLRTINNFEGHAIPTLIATIQDRWTRTWQ